MNDRQRLAHYQAELLETLYSMDSTQNVQESMRRLAEDADLPNMDSIDPRMVATAIELTRRWGVKSVEGE